MYFAEEKAMRGSAITEIRKDLLDLRERLFTEIRQKQSEATNVQDAGVPDPGDAGMTEDLRTFIHQLSDSKRAEILEIDEALLRIDDGTYGICEKCGEEIDTKRLSVMPYARHCIACQEEIEEEASKKSGPGLGKI
jgi:DnaK suppressor protein